MLCNKKTKWKLAILLTALVVILCSANVSEAAPMGTAFTYQGWLMDKNNPADGLYGFQFKLYDSNDPSMGAQLGSPIDINDLDVIDGHFIVELDFGSGIFNGDAVWLETRVVESPMGSDPATLSPLLELTPTPYAIYAETAGGDNDWQISGDDMYAIPSGTVSVRRSQDAAGPGLEVSRTFTSPQLGRYWMEIDDTSIDTYSFHFPVTSGTSLALNSNSGGNVGIGTTTPLSKLSVGGDGIANTGVYGSGSTYGVYGSSSSVGVFGRNSDTSSYGRLGYGGYGVYGSGSDTGVYGSGSDTGVYGSGTTFGVYGSGTTFGVYGSGSSVGVLGEDSDSGSHGRLGSGDWGGYFVGDGYFSGNVGIGTDSPQAKLHIGGTAGVDGIMYPDNTLQTTAAGGSASVPIGTVIDWWRPNSSFAVPDGYQICDGSVVNDAQSPFNGQTLPDLSGRFIRGTISPADIGTLGGNNAHTHSISGSTASKVVTMGTSTSNFVAGPSVVSVEVAAKGHKHTTNSHTHTSGSLANASGFHFPPYVVLLKIMRIR